MTPSWASGEVVARTSKENELANNKKTNPKSFIPFKKFMTLFSPSVVGTETEYRTDGVLVEVGFPINEPTRRAVSKISLVIREWVVTLLVE
jgi:hypothetical protein